ncbi:hypothetical protein, partial [Kitasatospora sp. MBT63]|uniref:hypothetical protein n=1 Tax=Kitasatospora sp. MBT63 TaxID=1444768 RepID=UPI00053B5E57
MAATDHADAQLSGDLVAEAAREAAAGNLPRAATLLLWSADLTEDRALREHRFLTAAVHTFFSHNGNGILAGHQLRQAVDACRPCAMRTILQSGYAYQNGSFHEALRLGERGLAEAEAEGDRSLIIQACVRLSNGAFHSGDRQTGSKLARRAVEEGAGLAGSANLQWTLGCGMLFTDGPREVLGEPWITALPDAPEATRVTDTIVLVNRGHCRLALGELHSAQADFAEVIKPGRAEGVSALARIHASFNLAICQYLLGD